MHVSNYFTTVALAFIQSGLFLIILKRKPLKKGHLILISLVLGLSAVSSSISIGFLAIWIVMLCWVFCQGTDLDPFDIRAKEVLQKFLIMSVGLVVCVALTQFPTLQSFTRGGSDAKITLMKLTSMPQEFLAALMIFIWLICLAIFFWVGGQSGWIRTIAKLEKLSRLGNVLAVAILFLIAGGCLMGLFANASPLPNIEAPKDWLAPLQYARATVNASFLSMAVVPVDFLFSASYWVGFGWLESLPSSYFVAAIRFIINLGVVACFVMAIRLRQALLVCQIVALYCGIEAMVFGLAIGASRIHSNLHGRYLIGYYMTLCVLSAFGWEAIARIPKIQVILSTRKYLLKQSIFLMILAIQGYFSWFILDRYF